MLAATSSRLMLILWDFYQATPYSLVQHTSCQQASDTEEGERHQKRKIVRGEGESEKGHIKRERERKRRETEKEKGQRGRGGRERGE